MHYPFQDEYEYVSQSNGRTYYVEVKGTYYEEGETSSSTELTEMKFIDDKLEEVENTDEVWNELVEMATWRGYEFPRED